MFAEDRKAGDERIVILGRYVDRLGVYGTATEPVAPSASAATQAATGCRAAVERLASYWQAAGTERSHWQTNG